MKMPYRTLYAPILLTGLLLACGDGAFHDEGALLDESEDAGSFHTDSFDTAGDEETPSSPTITDSIDFLQQIFPDDASWESVFVVAHNNANCNGKEILSRAHFLTAAAEHPRFCGNDSDEANLRELAAFLANVSLETNGAGAGQTNGGLCFASEVGCSDAGAACDYCSNLTPPWNTEPPQCPYGYYGRGALQITNPKNYHDTSMLVFGDDRLYQNPDSILEGATAWEASLAFWTGVDGGLLTSATSVQGKTTCHEAIAQNGDFGKTVEVINGNLECSNPGEAFIAKTAKRVAYYEAYLTLFSDRLGVSAPEAVNTTCDGGGGSGSANSNDPQQTRCGGDWSTANTTCGNTCSTSDDCTKGDSCYADLSLEPCG